MGIRKRRKRLTTTLSSYDQRIRAVELRPISLLTSAQINAAIDLGIATADENFYISSSAPNTYTRVEDAYYYPKKLTGKDADYVEVYTQPVLQGLSESGRIEVSGIHGTTAEIVDVTSNNFTVTDTDTSPWSGRESYEHDPTQDQDAGVVIGYSYSFTPESLGPSTWTTRKRLATKFQISSFSITGTTVTVTTSTNHKFEVGDVIFTSINDDAANNQESVTASGVDGIFAVTGVTSNTLEYELSAGVDSPTGTITPAANVYIYPTARNWSAVGDTWIDTSTNPDTTYYWTGLRWAEFTSTTQAVGGDSVAPNVVSNVAVVSAESGGYTDSSGAHRAKITLEWDAPTDDANGNALNDLAGYEVWASYVSGAEWTKSGLLSAETTFTIVDLDPAVTVYFNIYAVDTSLNRSTAVAFSTTSGTFAGTLSPPSAPDLASDLGVVTAKWDGLDNTGVNMHPSVRYIETHVSDTSPFTPSSSTKVASMAAGPDNYSSIYQYRETSTGDLLDMEYGQDYYFKFVAVDSAGNSTGGSTQSVARISQVDGASIEAGAISTYILNGESINATSNTSVYEIQLNANFLRAVHKTSGIETFRMNSSDGSVQLGAGITNTTIDGDQITVNNLNANSITSGTIDANQITVSNISATSITSGTLDADQITVTGSISGNVITGGTITGTQLKTATANRRIELQSTQMAVYDENDNFTGSIKGIGTANGATLEATSGGSGLVQIFQSGVGLYGGGGSSAFLGSNGFGMFDNKMYVYNGDFEIIGSNPTITFQKGFVSPVIRSLTLNASNQFEAEGFRASGNINCAGDFNYSAPSGTGTNLEIQSNNLVVKNSSSRKYKQQIEDAEFDTEAFMSAVVRQFKYNSDVENFGSDNAPLLYGYIAEEISDLGLDALVVTDEEGNPDAVRTNSVVAALHKIVQLQQARIESLETRLSSLEGSN